MTRYALRSMQRQDSPQQKPKAAAGPPEGEKGLGENGPSAKEQAAAEAARARLYGKGLENEEPCTRAEKLPDGPAPAAVEVHYPTVAELQPLERPEEQAQAERLLQEALALLQSKDWVQASRGLLLIRRLAAHHDTLCHGLLRQVVPYVTASVMSLRSSLCKTAIMCAADLCAAFQDAAVPYINVGGVAAPGKSLLAQLLLKAASNDKRFVVDAARGALGSLVDAVTPHLLLPRLLPFAAHKSPQWEAVDLPPLLRTGAGLLGDKAPEGRAAAKELLRSLQEALAGPQEEAGAPAEGGALEAAAGKSRWQALCEACLSPAERAAVQKAHLPSCRSHQITLSRPASPLRS